MMDLLKSHFEVYTNCKILKNFNMQHDLSKCQAQQMEYLTQYDYTMHYIKSKENMVMDALLRFSEQEVGIVTVLTLEAEEDIMNQIKEGYKVDDYTKKNLREQGT